jgi:hypothetical protein
MRNVFACPQEPQKTEPGVSKRLTIAAFVIHYTFSQEALVTPCPRD